MPLNLISAIPANSDAMCAGLQRGQAIATDGDYFGYWFSHRRA
ncbi:hypothetical protein [Stutzerimonas chloritidismutans]|uniref:Uncharacterized protein n=1 Tax=Stutzerimonas chloritidismutans TaxID=203192 RepID=A0ABU9M4Y3_STUCH